MKDDPPIRVRINSGPDNEEGRRALVDLLKTMVEIGRRVRARREAQPKKEKSMKAPKPKRRVGRPRKQTTVRAALEAARDSSNELLKPRAPDPPLRGRVIGAGKPTPDAWNKLIELVTRLAAEKRRNNAREETDHHDSERGAGGSGAAGADIQKAGAEGERRIKLMCPFYGYALFHHEAVGGGDTIMVPSQGNQCALITDAHSPCAMQIDGLRPEWEKCQRNPCVNGSFAKRD
jgi:hypothetical protein